MALEQRLPLSTGAAEAQTGLTRTKNTDAGRSLSDMERPGGRSHPETRGLSAFKGLLTASLEARAPHPGLQFSACRHHIQSSLGNRRWFPFVPKVPPPLGTIRTLKSVKNNLTEILAGTNRARQTCFATTVPLSSPLEEGLVAELPRPNCRPPSALQSPQSGANSGPPRRGQE